MIYLPTKFGSGARTFYSFRKPNAIRIRSPSDGAVVEILSLARAPILFLVRYYCMNYRCWPARIGIGPKKCKNLCGRSGGGNRFGRAHKYVICVCGGPPECHPREGPSPHTLIYTIYMYVLCAMGDK